LKNRGRASGKQLKLPLYRDETSIGEREEDAPVDREESLMERVLERGNLKRALSQVKRNKGTAGTDGMTIEDLTPYLKKHWPEIQTQLLEATYKPKPVKRVEIAKATGGFRKLGIPTVLDRFIIQALLQILQQIFDPAFSEHSYGFRPKRSAHQAIKQSQQYLRMGYNWVVDIDLEKFFDRVNHDKLMNLLKRRIKDVRILKLINRYLRSGSMSNDIWEMSVEGTPQGSPLSPLLANILLDELDKELERRGHCFVRYADDCNIYVKSKRSGERVMASITKYLLTKLKLKVNDSKSAVDRPWNRTFLGYTFTRGKYYRKRVSEKSIKRFKMEIRRITRRTKGRTIKHIIRELRTYILGWRSYFNLNEVTHVFKELDSWIRRKLRCYILKQWGRKRYKELKKRGISRKLAWNTTKSAHGEWRLSRSPALAFALPYRYFASMGLPNLYEYKKRST
jgi:RNA-directed DNA polymerase